MKRKINGRRSAPPTKKSEKFLKVKLRSIFTSLLELILSEIPEKSQCPPPEAAGRKNPLGRGGCGKRKGVWGKRNRRSRLLFQKPSTQPIECSARPTPKAAFGSQPKPENFFIYPVRNL
ncbi:MAG: hypothetical protein PHF07_01215 [Candidatus Pacebacteria bacterium]|nr:hypothetical protein [Candidatus Paceibacterota bacterium]